MHTTKLVILLCNHANIRLITRLGIRRKQTDGDRPGYATPSRRKHEKSGIKKGNLACP